MLFSTSKPLFTPSSLPVGAFSLPPCAPGAADDVVDSEDHGRALDAGLDGLHLDGIGLVKAGRGHVLDLASDAVDTEAAVLPGIIGGGVLRTQLGDGSDHGDATVGSEGAGNDLHGLSDGLVGPLHDSLHLLALPAEGDGHGHLGAAASEEELRLVHDVADDLHGVLEVALDLVEDVLGASTEEDGAGLGVLALLEEGEVLVAELPNLEEAAAGADVALLQLVGPADDGGPARPGNPVVIRLPEPPERRDARLGEIVLGEVTHALLCDDNVGVKGDDLRALVLDVLLLHAEHGVPVGLVSDLDVRLGLALLVLEGAIEEHDTGVLDAPAHLGVRDVLVEHDAVQDLAVVDLTAGDLLHLGIPLDVDLLPAADVDGDAQNGIEGHLHELIRPAARELRADGRLDELRHEGGVAHVDVDCDLLTDAEGLL
mmetsp:Transcript_14603/g.29778  ORF Transcript_14603/g.29778 Transcript_14603/m.29778 type:complete len:428 (+) Transcript_14603:27-1310(+)